ncbi:MAG: hypothetical protein KBT47_02965 [Armatimonadetes bacterium]|nr:hypothetical protein [Candidatus Hippobium faecium]
MKLKKGHIIGFLSTVFVFACAFFYIYLGTMETVWIYDIKDTSKVKLGKNIYKAVFSENEQYLAWVTYGGILKLAEVKDLKNVIYTCKEADSVFFAENNLVVTDKNGKAFMYSPKDKTTTNYLIDCFNKYIWFCDNKIYTAEKGAVCHSNLFGEENFTEIKCDIEFDNPDNLIAKENSLCVFSEKELKIYNLSDMSVKKVLLNNYAGKGNVTEDGIIYYVNKNGVTEIINKENKTELSEIKNPHSVSYSEKEGTFIISDKKKTACYDITSKKLWEKEMYSARTVLNRKGDFFIDIYPKVQASVYSAEKGEEIYSLDNLINAEFSKSDNYIIGTEKSSF